MILIVVYLKKISIILFYLLIEKPIKRKNYIYLSIVIFVIVSFTLFPLWPLWMKHAIWWMLVMLIILLVSYYINFLIDRFNRFKNILLYCWFLIRL